MLRSVKGAGILGRGLLLAAAIQAGGCSLNGDEEPRTARGAPNEVARVVHALEVATRRREWATICDELFTAAARRRAGGRDCARLLAESGKEVLRPRIELLEIELKEGGARARVRTRARGQRPLEDTLVLRRVRGDYRIEALAG
jgi:hypothetical protein